MNPKDALIVALDHQDVDYLKNFVEKVGDNVSFYKVGLEAFLFSNGTLVPFLKDKGKKVFLDLKFHDIPNTVISAMNFALESGVDFFSFHSLIGQKGLAQIAKFLKEKNSIEKALAVNVLTSMDQEDFSSIYKQGTPASKMVELVEMVFQAGFRGSVCSALESKILKEKFPQMTLVTPGIRLQGAQVQDQARVASPSFAIQNGADYLVMGRNILENENPLSIIEQVFQEIEKGGK